MNVLVNCLSAISGGAVSYLRNLLPRLYRLFEESPQSHCLTVLAHDTQRELLRVIPDSQRVLINGIRLTGYRRLWWEYWNVNRIAHEKKAEVLFVPYQVSPRVRTAKQVLMLRNMDPFFFSRYSCSGGAWLRNRFLEYQSIKSLSAADRVIAVSQYVSDFLTRRLNITGSHIRRIYHGCDKSFNPEWDRDVDRELLCELKIEGDFVLTCGSLVPYRRCEDVISAFAKNAENFGKPVKLVIAGGEIDTRYGKFIRRMIDSCQCRDQIAIVGHVSQATMKALYRRCSMCIIASEVEACPNIAIEAVSCGCVIISSDQGPLPEILDGCSLQFESRNIDELATKMDTCMKDTWLRTSLRLRGIKRAEAFSWEKCAEKTYSALVDWADN